MAVRRSLGSLTLVALAASASAQIPSRRLQLTAATAPDPRRAHDLSDGVAVPRQARSVRVEREGEVLRSQPDSESSRRGTVARGVRLPALEATQSRGCRGAWVRVHTDAWLCTDGSVEFSADPPESTQLPAVPEGQVVPYQYAFATRAGVRTFRRLDDVADDNWAEELERGMSVAVVGTQRVAQGTFVRTANGRWVSMRELAWARPSERAGIFYEPSESTSSVGFLRNDVAAWPTPEAALRGGRRGGVSLTRRDGVHIREELTLRHRRLVRIDAGWLLAAAVLRPEVPAAPHDVGATERWVDVDRARQVLVAFEGGAPVFATLVSSGRPGNPTAPGEHRVWAKLATTDMSNVDDSSITSAAALYTVSRVPWVMFFHNDQALHGAFWHDMFGQSHSHGCVNLAPREAAWLFSWAPPALPSGWTAVMPTPREPGLRVRVR
ncbi:MAG: L,D-transpeptidase [Polyangiales bacterium]